MHDAEAQAHIGRLPRSHFDPEKEKRDQDGTEYQFGSIQSLPNIFEIPLAIREEYLPVGQIQYSQWGDYMDCATRDPINAVEAYLTYAYRNGLLLPENKAFLEQYGYVTYDQRILVSNRFNAILSGTTRRGNSLKAPLQSIHSDGFIPQHMLPEEGFTFDSYHDEKAITNRMREIGKEAAKRFTFAYDQAKQSQFAGIAEKDFVSVALYAWPQAKNGVYPKTDKPSNHAVAIFRPRYFVIDNYFEAEGDFIKELAPDFVFYEDGYRMYFSSQQVPKKVTIADLLAYVPLLQAALIQIGLLRKQQQEELPVPQPVPATPVTELKWDKANARHSVRVICDEMGLTLYEKNVITACIQQESGFDNAAVGRNMRDGKLLSTDWGICQINDYWHVGPGKKWSSVQQILDNPEKAVRWMITLYKQGQLKLWVSYSSGAYMKYMPK